MKNLFDKTYIKNLELKNRFIRSALHEGLAERDNSVSDVLIQEYEKLAEGGAALLMTGYCSVIEGEKASPGMISLSNDSFIEKFQKLTDTVHKHGAKIFLQMVYCGSQAKYQQKKRTIWGASPVEHKYTQVTPLEMTKEDIHTLVNAFGDAAVRAKKSGFDGVQLHAAHGYLLSQFLAPYYNRRTDEYGGNTENRARIIFEALQNIKEKTGEDFPVAIKINCQDYMGEEGLQFDETRFICKKLDEMGIDLIEISGNVGFSEVEPPVIRKSLLKDKSRQSYFSEFAKIIASEVKAPVSVVGGNRDTEILNEILNNSEISHFSLARTLLCEPDLVNKWQNNPAHRPKCVSCNQCFSLRGNICIFNRKKAKATV